MARGRLAAATPANTRDDVVGGQLAVPLGVGLELFEDLGCMGHRLLFAADVDPAFAGRDAYAQRVADLRTCWSQVPKSVTRSLEVTTEMSVSLIPTARAERPRRSRDTLAQYHQYTKF